jgi:hypothetical protein
MSEQGGQSAREFDKFWEQFWQQPGEQVMSGHKYNAWYSEHAPAHIRRFAEAYARERVSELERKLLENMPKVERELQASQKRCGGLERLATALLDKLDGTQPAATVDSNTLMCVRCESDPQIGDDMKALREAIRK